MRKCLFILTVLITFSFNCQKKEGTDPEGIKAPKPYIPTNTAVDVPVWSLRASISPDDTINVLKMSFTDELGLITKSYYCKVIFENTKSREYKLVAPWIKGAIVLQKTNILSDKIETVHKDSMRLTE